MVFPPPGHIATFCNSLALLQPVVPITPHNAPQYKKAGFSMNIFRLSANVLQVE